MKLNNRINLLLILFLVLFSCEDMLEEKPRDLLSPGQFFNNGDEAIGAVNGIYSNLRGMFGAGKDFTQWSHMGTDISRISGGRETKFPMHVYSLSASNFYDLADHWLDLYKAVGDANMVIARVENNEKIEDEVQKQVIGEAKYLRAFFYYWLTNFWGDVPMWLDELNITEISGNIERTAVSDVRNQIITDLLEAIEFLPSTYPDNLKGKPTKWAAKMLLCKTYLWEKQWQQAKDVASDIIQNSPHSLSASFDDIFGIENEYSEERIWELDYIQDVYSTNYHSRYTPRPKDEPTVPGYDFTGYGQMTAIEEFVNSFDSVDLRLPWFSWKGTDSVETDYWYVLKWIDWNAPRANSDMNIIIYRLADAYLMLAEAEFELNGPTTEAYSAINTIRERAGVPLLDNLTDEEFRQAIIDERKWELAFECHRRWDLNRWGILVEVVQSTEKTNPLGAASVGSQHMLCPIPPEEIGKNPALTQNPGYQKIICYC